MSNYCKDCAYKVSKKTGEDASRFNSLYWNFRDDKREHFKDNQRMNIMMGLLDKKYINDLEALKKREKHIIEHPDQY